VKTVNMYNMLKSTRLYLHKHYFECHFLMVARMNFIWDVGDVWWRQNLFTCVPRCILQITDSVSINSRTRASSTTYGKSKGLVNDHIDTYLSGCTLQHPTNSTSDMQDIGVQQLTNRNNRMHE